MNSKMWVASVILATAAPAAVCCETGANSGPGQAGGRSPPDLEQLMCQVLQPSELSPKIARNKLPWYFYYESGVELLNEGQAGPALEKLRMTAALKPSSQRSVRMYGMWFVDYLPYYRLSLAYSELEEWSMAWNAIELSERMNEFTPEDPDFLDFTALKILIESKLSAES
jgi:hypothetical protein